MTLKQHVLRTISLRHKEWVLAYAQVWLSFALWFAPENVNSSLFKTLHNIFPIYVWATSLLIVGLVRMVALSVNGLWPPTYTIRVVASVMSLGIWFNVFWSFVMSAMNQGIIPGVVLSQVPLLLELSVVMFASKERVMGKQQSAARK